MGSSSPFTNNLLPSFVIGKHFEVFRGASINYMMSSNVADKSLFAKNTLWNSYTDSKLQSVSVDYQVGVQYIF